MTNSTSFGTGPYGEILPPPLVSGVDPEEAAVAMVRASRQAGQPIVSIPTKGESRRGYLNQALLYLHQQNLTRALAGQLDEPDAAALRDAVLRGQTLSLRPLGLEQLYFSSFAPVVQQIGDNLWRIGLPGQGRVKTFSASAGEAIVQAQRLYVEWSTAEAEQFKAWARQATTQLEPDYHHLVWLADLTTTADLTAELAAGFALQRLGKHSTYRLTTPKGWRIVEAGRPERAIAIAAAVLRQQQIILPRYEPADVLAALVMLGVRLPQPVGKNIWQVNGMRGQALSPDRVMLQTGGSRYLIGLQETRLDLIDLEKRQTLERLGIEADWPTEARLLVGLAWAAWQVRRPA